MSRDTATIAQLPQPSHSCLIYQTSNEQIEVTCEFLIRGLTRGEKCVFLESPDRLQAIREALIAAHINVDSEESRGALILSPVRDFLEDGHFTGKRTIAFLEKTVKQALAEGYTGLRATGDMNWELGTDQQFELLADYEAELDRFVSHHPIVGLCQYRRHSLSGLTIRNALETHRNVILGRLLCANNFYYEPPDIRLERDLAEAQAKRAEWMCRTLDKTVRTENALSRALESFTERQKAAQPLPKRA